MASLKQCNPDAQPLCIDLSLAHGGAQTLNWGMHGEEADCRPADISFGHSTAAHPFGRIHPP